MAEIDQPDMNGESIIVVDDDGASDSVNFQNLKVEVAKAIALEIVAMPAISLEDLDDLTNFIDNSNQITSIINRGLGTEIPILDGAGLKSFEKYVPLIVPLDRLRESAVKLDEDDPGSVDDFYLKLAVFAADVALIQSGALHKVSYQGTGVVLRLLKSTGIKKQILDVCGTQCLGKFSSATYSFLRSQLTGFAMTFDEWDKEIRSSDLERVGAIIEKRADMALRESKEVLDHIAERVRDFN